MMSGHNDNGSPLDGRAAGVILAFPTEPIARRRDLRHRLTHHEDGRPKTADELAEDLEVAVIMGGVDAVVDISLDHACGDHELAACMLMHAVNVLDRRALIERAERILGPRRRIGGEDGPRAA